MHSIEFIHPIGAGWTITLLLFGSVLLGVLYSRFSVSVRPPVRMFLIGLRILLLLSFLFIILDPYWTKENKNEWIGILFDNSLSMGLKEETGESRGQALMDYLDRDAFPKELFARKVKKKLLFDRDLQPLSSNDRPDFKGRESRLLHAMTEINRAYLQDPDLLGWIVFSDGALTDTEKIDFQPQESVPWILMGLEGEKPIPNLLLRSADLPLWSYVGEKAVLTLNWESTLVSKKHSVKVLVDGREYATREISGDQGEEKIPLSFQQEGRHRVDVDLIPSGPETVREDNSGRFWIDVVTRKIKIFYAESFYKDENLFKKALEQEKGFEVHFASTLSAFAREHGVPFVKDPLYGLPKTRKEMLGYDVVIFSDLRRNLLNQEQINGIRELVEEGGGAFIMIGGMDSFGDGGYVGSDIERLLPVEISEEYKKDVYLAARGVFENPFRPVVPVSAADHPVLRIVEDAHENRDLWKSIPLLGGYNYVGRLKPGAVLLLQHPVDKSDYGPRTIMAAQTFGRGKVLAFTSDVTPNWGEEFEGWKDEKHGWVYSIFWRRMIKWLTESRLRYRDAPVGVHLTPSMPDALLPVRISWDLPPGLQDRSSLQRITAKIFKGEQEVESYASTFGGEGHEVAPWFAGPLAPGDYRLRVTVLRSKSDATSFDRVFTVHSSRVEMEHLEPQPKSLEEIAAKTGGIYLSFSKRNQLKKAIENLRRRSLQKHSAPFWKQPWIYLVLVGILCVDWFLRKKTGLE